MLHWNMNRLQQAAIILLVISVVKAALAGFGIWGGDPIQQTMRESYVFDLAAYGFVFFLSLFLYIRSSNAARKWLLFYLMGYITVQIFLYVYEWQDPLTTASGKLYEAFYNEQPLGQMIFNYTRLALYLYCFFLLWGKKAKGLTAKFMGSKTSSADASEQSRIAEKSKKYFEGEY